LPANLEQLITDFRASGVTYVGIVGKDCAHIEDVIDEICVGYGTDIYYLQTASHPNESLEEAVEFARSLGAVYKGEVQVIEC
jgi:hypothetical protein